MEAAYAERRWCARDFFEVARYDFGLTGTKPKAAAMQNPKRTHTDGLSKFQRYRRGLSNRGMKQLRIWVPDPTRPEFSEEAERQAALLRGRPEEREALDFIEAAFDWPEP